MKLIFNLMLLIIFLTTMIMMLTVMLSKKMMYDREKNSPFECGFDPKGKTRLPFSLRFFLIAIIFLIFDVEIALMLPMILTMSVSNQMIWLYITLYFIMILILGLYHEWKFGALNWLM